MSACMRELPLEVHIAVEQFNSRETSAVAIRVPSYRDIVVGRDVETVETVAACIESGALGIGRDFVNKNVAAIAGEYEMVAVEADVRFAISVDGRILTECVNDRSCGCADVIRLLLIAADVIQNVSIRSRPSRLRRSIDLHRQVS